MDQSTIAPGGPGVPGFAAGGPAIGRGADPGPVPLAPRPIHRTRPPGLGRAARGIVLTSLLIAGVSLARLLPDWEEARWWLISAVGLALAAVIGLVALVHAVGGTGEARRRPHMAGVPLGVALVVVATLVLAGGILRAADDWADLDVPAAWERLGDGGPALLTARAEDPATVLFRTSAEAGECREGDLDDPGRQVDCDTAHRLEVTGEIELPTDADDGVGIEANARALCSADPDVPATPDEGTAGVVVPEDGEWDAGRRDALCVVVWPDPVTGLQTD